MSWRAFVVFLVIMTAAASAQFPAEKPSVESGRAIFSQNCAGCHGAKGDGSGISGAYNFTDNARMINRSSTEFFASITNGRPNTAMPAFGNRLSEAQRWDVIAYIWTFWADSDSSGRGKSIYETNCATCHGIKGDGASIGGAFNFTDLRSMVNEHPAMFFEGVTNGVPDTLMPAWKDRLSENARWDAVRYVWTFQFHDYAVSLTPAPSPGVQAQATGEWYNNPAGIAIILVSLLIAAGILYLFIRGLRDR